MVPRGRRPLERGGSKRLEMLFRLFALCLLTASAAKAGEIKKLGLDMIRDPLEIVSQPVFDSSGGVPLSIGTITSTVNRKTVARRQSKGVFTFGVKADLGPSVDLGALLAEAMRAAAPVMGLRMQSGEGAVWKVSGTLKDAVMESKQLTNYGPLVCYGYFELELTVEKDGQARQLPLRAHGKYYLPERSAAKGLVATMHLASREILTRLNREFLKAPPHPAIAGLLADLKAHGAKDKHVQLTRVGLSGDPSAAPVLIDLLPSTRTAGTRALIINALANLGSPAALPLLAQRYATEDGDGRFYTLKAFDYIGGEKAMALVSSSGSLTPRDPARTWLSASQGRPPGPSGGDHGIRGHSRLLQARPDGSRQRRQGASNLRRRGVRCERPLRCAQACWLCSSHWRPSRSQTAPPWLATLVRA